jgi:hypothetical protein
MNLSIKELNDLYYCVSMLRIRGNELSMINDKELEVLTDKIWSELVERNRENDDEEKEVYN